MNNFNNIQLNSNLLLSKGNSEPKVQNDSTSSSINDENQKNILENNNNKLIINQNLNNINQINMELQNVNEDIFPKERLEGKFNYTSNSINSLPYIQKNNKLNENSIEIIFAKNKDIIMKEDIPEMILYKYNYDFNLYKESLRDIDYEAQWLYNFINVDKVIEDNEKKNKVKNCIQNLLIEYKEKKLDIPFIIANCKKLYDKFFTQSQIVELLSFHDAAFLRLQKKRKKIINIFDYIIKDEESSLSENISNYFKKEYILEAKNETELDLIEAQLAILTYVNQSVEIDENYKKLINYDMLSNLNIDINLLNKIKDNKLNDILRKFCLSPEQVVHNIKVINGELNSNLIQPPFPNCSLGEICQAKMAEINGKFKTSNEILILSLDYYILLLSSHPYIFKLIYEKLYKICTLSTSPTDKGKEILNSLHPSYNCKRINKIPISSFFQENNKNICNIYTNEFGDLYLDIEKCLNNGLIKCEINTGVDAQQIALGNGINELINLLIKAVNGTLDINIEQFNNNLLMKKQFGARKLAIKNMVLVNKYSQEFFLNYIKNKLHDYSEKYIIKKISDEFYNLISRNYLDKIIIDENSFIISIIYNSRKKYFKCILLDSNFKIIKLMKLEYLWKNEKISESSLNKTLSLSKEVTNLQNLIKDFNPKAIIIDVSDLECYKMINYIRSKFKNSKFICSDYISKIQNLKILEITEEQENKYAIDQVKFIINPVNQIIELWNYKYEDNLLLNLTFHPQQENIKDIPFFNYSLESQIIRVVNSKGIILSNLTKYSYNLFNFISGFGPCTSSHIINNISKPFEIKNSLEKSNPNIYRNISPFIFEKKKIENFENNFSLVKLDIFYSMIKDNIYFKKKCLCNAIVSDIDTKNKVVNCFLLRDCNSIKAILRFENIDQNIENFQKFFYPQRIILCKIIDIKLAHHSYDIYISNRNDDLISVKDFYEEEKKYKIFQNFIIDEDQDFIIKDIKKLKEIQQYDQGNLLRRLKYCLKDLENEQFLMNINYTNIKKFLEKYNKYNKVDYRIRPSFLGENHLTLTFYILEGIFLNYDIKINKIELDNYNEKNEKTFMINYALENEAYKSLNELVDLFATKMVKRIKEFQKSEYFKTPREIENLLYQIFNIKSINDQNDKKIKNEIENENNEIMRINDIILGFMKESPEYGLFFTKLNNDYNYSIDFIKILYNGFLFHGKVFNSLNDVINFYKDVNRTNHFQSFIKRQFICNIHSQIEEIDEKYEEFEGVDQNLERYNKINYPQTNEMKELKENLLFQNSNSKDNNIPNNELLGKKRNPEENQNNPWNNMNPNWEENNFGMNDNNENNNWENNYTSKNNNKKFNNANSKNNNKNKDSDNKNNKNKRKVEGNKKSWNDKNNNNDNWNNSNNNDWNDNSNNNDWNDNSNNLKENTQKAWGKTNINSNENDGWGNSNNNNDLWNSPNKNNYNYNNLNEGKNDPWNKDNNNNENDVLADANSGNAWENSKNDKSNNDWAESNNNNSSNNSNRNKKNYNKQNKNEKRENKNKNKGSNFSWDNNNKSNEHNFNKNKDKENKGSKFSWANDNNNDNKSNWNNNDNENKESNFDWGNEKKKKENNYNWNSDNKNQESKFSWENNNNENTEDNYNSKWNIDNKNKGNNFNKNNNNNKGSNFSWGNNSENKKSNYNSNVDNENENKKSNYNSNWNNENENKGSNSGWGNDKRKKENNFNKNNYYKKNKESKFDWGIDNINTTNKLSLENPNNNNNNENPWNNSNNNKTSFNSGGSNNIKNNDIDNWASNNNASDETWGYSNNKGNNNNNNWADENNKKNNDDWGGSGNYKNISNSNNFNKKDDYSKKNNSNFNKNKKNDRNNDNNNNKFNNKNKNYGNKNNNNSWNKNNNNNKSSFSGWLNNSNNLDNNKKNNFNFNNKWNNDDDPWGASPKKTNNVHNKGKKRKVRWASELDNNFDGSKDIKEEKDGDVINFENKEGFGGYKV